MIQMSETQTLSDRIDALEIRLSFQDETIETLNKTITAQWQQIDALTRQVAGLNERLQEAEAVACLPAGLRARLQGRRRSLHQDHLRRWLLRQRRQ